MPTSWPTSSKKPRMLDLVIKGGTVVTPIRTTTTDVGIKGETIAALGPELFGKREIDATNLLVLPGVIDAHTHMELPVRGSRSSDDFLSGTIAAACGGVTTIADFSVGAPDTSLPDEIEARLKIAGKAAIDYTLHGEVVGWQRGHESEFAEAITLGVRTFKFYMTYSRSGRMSDDGVLCHAFLTVARHGGRAMVHAENDAIINALTDTLAAKGELDISALPRSRPAICEAEAITRAAIIAQHTDIPLRIAHISSELGLNAVVAARAAGGKITAETCPQYLLLNERAYAEPDGHLYAATPPLRTQADCQALWEGLSTATIDLVATDHCPFTRDQKCWTGSFLDLPYGLPGVETLLPLLYSEGVARKRITLEQLVELLSAGPAKALGIYPRKGAISVGSDADLVLIEPARKWTISANKLHMRTDFNPYEGRKVFGCPVMTLSRGRAVSDGETFCGEEGWGQFIPQTV